MAEGKTHTKSVDRSNPGCIIFLLDQSFSMMDGLAGRQKPKIEILTTAINRFISELIISCEKGDEKPRHYFDIAAIGYTSDKDTGVRAIINSVLQGPLAGRDVVSVVDLFDNPLEIEKRQKDDGAGGLVTIDFPIWYRKPPEDQMAATPMCAALENVHRIASDWIAAHPNSFPPVVLHITDGESSDGDPEPIANALKSLATNDGNVLLFNCHLSSTPSEGILFPASEDEIPDNYGKVLFRMSSTLPDKLRMMAEAKALKAPANARGMAFNAGGTEMLLLISVGTAVAAPQNLR